MDPIIVAIASGAALCALVGSIVSCLCCARQGSHSRYRESSDSDDRRDTIQLEDLLSKPTLADPESVFSEFLFDGRLSDDMSENIATTDDITITTNSTNSSTNTGHEFIDELQRNISSKKSSRKYRQKSNKKSYKDLNNCPEIYKKRSGDNSQTLHNDLAIVSNKTQNLQSKVENDKKINDALQQENDKRRDKHVNGESEKAGAMNQKYSNCSLEVLSDDNNRISSGSESVSFSSSARGSLCHDIGVSANAFKLPRVSIYQRPDWPCRKGSKTDGEKERVTNSLSNLLEASGDGGVYDQKEDSVMNVVECKSESDKVKVCVAPHQSQEGPEETRDAVVKTTTQSHIAHDCKKDVECCNDHYICKTRRLKTSYSVESSHNDHNRGQLPDRISLNLQIDFHFSQQVQTTGDGHLPIVVCSPVTVSEDPSAKSVENIPKKSQECKSHTCIVESSTNKRCNNEWETQKLCESQSEQVLKQPQDRKDEINLTVDLRKDLDVFVPKLPVWVRNRLSEPLDTYKLMNKIKNSPRLKRRSFTVADFQRLSFNSYTEIIYSDEGAPDSLAASNSIGSKKQDKPTTNECNNEEPADCISSCASDGIKKDSTESGTCKQEHCVVPIEDNVKINIDKIMDVNEVKNKPPIIIVDSEQTEYNLLEIAQGLDKTQPSGIPTATHLQETTVTRNPEEENENESCHQNETKDTEDKMGAIVETATVEDGQPLNKHVDARHIQQQHVDARHIQQQHVDARQNKQHVDARQIQQQHGDTRQIQQQHVDARQIQQQHVDARQIQQQHIDARQIQQQHVDARQIQQQHVDARQNKQQHVDARHIQQQQVDARQIQHQHVDARQIQQQHVDARHIQQQQVDARQIQQQHVDARQIQQQHVDARQIQQQHVDAQQIQQQHVDARQIQQQHVDARQIQQQHVDARQIQQQHVDAQQIQQQHVDARQIQQQHVDARQIQQQYVDTNTNDKQGIINAGEHQEITISACHSCENDHINCSETWDERGEIPDHHSSSKDQDAPPVNDNETNKIISSEINETSTPVVVDCKHEPEYLSDERGSLENCPNVELANPSIETCTDSTSSEGECVTLNPDQTISSNTLNDSTSLDIDSNAAETFQDQFYSSASSMNDSFPSLKTDAKGMSTKSNSSGNIRTVPSMTLTRYDEKQKPKTADNSIDTNNGSDDSDYDNPWDSLDNAVKRASIKYHKRPSAAATNDRELMLKSAEDLGRLIELAEQRRRKRLDSTKSTCNDLESDGMKTMPVFTRSGPLRHTVKGVLSRTSNDRADHGLGWNTIGGSKNGRLSKDDSDHGLRSGSRFTKSLKYHSPETKKRKGHWHVHNS